MAHNTSTISRCIDCGRVRKWRDAQGKLRTLECGHEDLEGKEYLCEDTSAEVCLSLPIPDDCPLLIGKGI